MLIVWGTKIRRKPRGYGLHFCPICRELKSCKVTAVLKVDHIYFIPAGRSDPVLNELTCPTCKSIFARTLDAPLTAQKEEIQNPHEAVARLLADESEWLLERMDLENRIARASREERTALIAEPIIALAYEHDLSGKKGWRESLSAVAGLFIIIGVFAAAILWFSWADRKNDPTLLAWAIGSSAFTLALTTVLGWVTLTSTRRRARRMFQARIARSLRPLQPRPDELTEVFVALRARANELAASTDLPALQLAIDVPRDQAVAA